LNEPNFGRSLLLRVLDAVEPEYRFPVTLLAVGYLACSQQYREAENLLEPLLDDEQYGKLPALWQLAGCVADAQGKLARSVTCQEMALELALSNVTGKVEVAAIRKSHGSLLRRYDQLANALATLDDQASAKLISRVVHVADRWRTIDDQLHRPCRAAAKVLHTLGDEQLAWDYLTTPLALKPNEAAPWRELAETLRGEGQFEMADRAYEAAFEAEPTDAELLWERAQLLKQVGRPDEANRLYQQLAEGEWQPRFEYLRQRAARLLRE
jgi:tetratricopeptide (TPR) repeat protein